MTQPLVSQLARRFRVEVDTGTDPVTPTWSRLVGLSDWNPKVADPELQDSSDYDSDGWTSQEKTAQAWSAEATVLRKTDNAGAFPVAQETLRKAALLFGSASRVRMRWYDRNGGPEAYQGTALVQWERDGTGVTDLDSAKITLTGVGALVEITNPVNTGSLAIAPDPAAVAIDDIVALTATATLADASTQDVTGDAVWQSSDPATATVRSGFVTGKAAGTADITATYGAHSDTVTVTVS